MSDDGWQLVMAFPDQSPSFAHGFACGRVWEQMKSGRSPIDGMLPAECRTTIEAMAMANGWVERIDRVDDDWIRVTLTKG